MISYLRKWDRIAFVSLGVTLAAQLWLLWDSIDPNKKAEAVGLSIGMIVLLIVFLGLHFRSLNDLHGLRVRIDKSLGRLSDEAMHVEKLHRAFRDELGNAAIDNTVHGAFVYARQKILVEGCDCTMFQEDFEDREFDLAMIVKRKSTPIDEVLAAAHRAGRL